MDIGDRPYNATRDFAAGGDQPMTCPEMARVGQLLLNAGVWSDSNGSPYQMVQPGFVKEMFTPQHPGWDDQDICEECKQ